MKRLLCVTIPFTCVFFVCCSGGDIGLTRRVFELETERYLLIIQLAEEKERVVGLRKEDENAKVRSGELERQRNDDLTIEIGSLQNRVQKEFNPRKVATLIRSVRLVEFRAEVDVPFTLHGDGVWKCDWDDGMIIHRLREGTSLVAKVPELKTTEVREEAQSPGAASATKTIGNTPIGKIFRDGTVYYYDLGEGDGPAEVRFVESDKSSFWIKVKGFERLILKKENVEETWK